MADNTDFDATAAIYGPESMGELRDKMFDELLDVCSGRQVAAEVLGFTETAL